VEDAVDCVRRTWRPADYVFLAPLVLVVVGIALAARKKTRRLGTALATIGAASTFLWGGFTAYRKA
jgi:hypothetical protein